MRWVKRVIIAIPLIVVAALGIDAATYDAMAWSGDYARLKGDMAQGYANLDWQAERKGIDLAALDRETQRRIATAHSRIRATMALNAFVARFEDPHLRLALARPGDAAGQRQSSSVDPAPAPEPVVTGCGSAGYSADDPAFALPFAKVAGTKPVKGDWFPAAINGDVGIIRIAAFGEDRYAAACEAAFKPGMTDRALQLATRAKLQVEIKSTIARLKTAGARRMLVDVTGNGGGTEWVSEAIALFTDRRMTRHEARIVGPDCDRRAIWSGAKPACPVFGAANEAPARIDGTGDWTRSIMILGDRGTGSATEDFIAWLVDNKAATYAGQPTVGAGCGFVNGGNPSYLRVAPLVVHMPNCARFRKDGSNEVDGIKPDIPIALSEMEDAQQRMALGALLARMRAAR